MRYTSKAYIQELTEINRTLAFRCSVDYVAYGGRYDMTYSDRYTMAANGELGCYGCIECGTPREAVAGAYRLQRYASTPAKLTREQCKAIAHIAGLDFNFDFHSIGTDHVNLLLDLAKKSGYRKPAGANGSTARAFFAHLQKRVKTDLNHYSFNTAGIIGK